MPPLVACEHHANEGQCPHLPVEEAQEFLRCLSQALRPDLIRQDQLVEVCRWVQRVEVYHRVQRGAAQDSS